MTGLQILAIDSRFDWLCRVRKANNCLDSEASKRQAKTCDVLLMNIRGDPFHLWSIKLVQKRMVFLHLYIT